MKYPTFWYQPITFDIKLNHIISFTTLFRTAWTCCLVSQYKTMPWYTGIKLFRMGEFENCCSGSSFFVEHDVLLCFLHHWHQGVIHSFVVVVAVHIYCDVTRRLWGGNERCGLSVRFYICSVLYFSNCKQWKDKERTNNNEWILLTKI